MTITRASKRRPSFKPSEDESLGGGAILPGFVLRLNDVFVKNGP
jgi:hypothetical protein